MKYGLVIVPFALILGWGARHWSSLQTYIDRFKTEITENEHLAATVKGRYEQEFLMTYDPATGQVPTERLIKAYKIAQDKRAQLALKDEALPIYWHERGPNNIGGRTRALLFDANDATGKTVWAGSVAGGLWRTTNIDGTPANWASINDFFANLAITTIAQDPSNTNVLYFGTGEGYGNYDAVNGLGIWKSTDGGTNWSQLGSSTVLGAINKIVVDNTGRVIAATTSGLRRSPDGGNTWPKILGAGASAISNNVQDFEIAANGDYFAGVNSDGIYRFKSGSWSKLSSGLPTQNYGRIEIACAPGNTNIAYAVFEDTTTANSGNPLAIVETTNEGNSWVSRTVPAAGNQCWYDLIMAVDPNDATRVWMAAVGMFVSGDSGNTWNGVGGIHSDNHNIVYRPGNSDEMVLSNDGGIYRCTNGSNASPTMSEKNDGYNVTQYLSGALHPNAGSNYVLGGTQDNGTCRFTTPGLTSADQPIGGDGGFCFIDQDNPNIQIGAYVNRQFYLSTNGGGSFPSLVSSNSKSLFITPAEYDDGANVLYLSDIGGDIGRVTDIGGANTFTTENLTAFGMNTVGRVSAVAVSPNTANRIFIGTENGLLTRMDNANQNGMTTQTAITPAGSGSYISCIVVEPGNDNHLLVTYSNFGVVKIRESTDGGASWTNIQGDLPDMPVRWAMFHPFLHNQILLATELGVWTTDNLNGTTTKWWPTNNFGLANVRVDMLQYRSSDHLVIAATHGRGMFDTDYFSMLNMCTPNLNLSGTMAPGMYMAKDFITSTAKVNPGVKVIYQAGNHIDLKPGFRAFAGSDFWGLIQECGIGPKPFPVKNEDVVLRDDPPLNPLEVGLRCFPNPTTFSMQATFSLPEDGTYSIYIRNIQGQLIQTIAAGEQALKGQYQILVDAAGYQTGMYVLTLQTSKGAVSERFAVVR